MQFFVAEKHHFFGKFTSKERRSTCILLELFHPMHQIVTVHAEFIQSSYIIIAYFYLAENKCLFKYINGASGSVKAISKVIHIINTDLQVS